MLQMDPNTGAISPESYSVAYGCGTDPSTYNFLILPPYAPRETSYRSGQIRMYHTFTMDASLDKSFPISERAKFQLRLEAFNVLNHYAFPLERFNANPFDPNFGSLFPGRISTVNSGFPRQLQLGAKFLW